MIESYAIINTTFHKSDQSKWQALINGFAQNQHGAYLEKYAEAFGEAAEQADELAEELAEEYL